MTEPKVWQISRRQATVGMLLVSDWARIVREAELAAAVADRLSRCENEFPPTALAGLAVQLAADLVRNNLDGDQFDRYLPDAFDPTGPVLVKADLVKAARVSDDVDAVRAAIGAAIAGYGAVMTVVAAVQCLRAAVEFVYEGRAAAVLDDNASTLAGRLFAAGGEL